MSGGRLTGLKIFCDPDNVYEYNSGEPTLIAAGMLLENMCIAAANLGRRLTWDYQGAQGATHRLALSLVDDVVAPDPLYGAIYTRSVDRRPYQRRPLDAADKHALAAAAGDRFRLDWFESADQRRGIARLMAIGTDIRLRIPETFEIHRRIVDWNRKLSPRGIPASALGLDAMTVKMMRWSLAKKARTDLSNALGSPAMASLQMDRLPAMASAAFFSFRLREGLATRPAGPATFFQAGQAVQRFWLAATRRGLAIQPSFAPLAFSWYGREGVAFTSSGRGLRSARTLAGKMESFFPHAEELVFLGRIGWPRPNLSPARSTRADLGELVKISG